MRNISDIQSAQEHVHNQDKMDVKAEANVRQYLGLVSKVSDIRSCHKPMRHFTGDYQSTSLVYCYHIRFC